MDWFSLLVGAAVLATGYSSGWARGYIAGKKKIKSKLEQPVKPICSCKHPLSSHDDQGCHEKIEGRPIKWDSYAEPIQYESLPCPCKKYVGPQPIETFFTSPALPPSES